MLASSLAPSLLFASHSHNKTPSRNAVSTSTRQSINASHMDAAQIQRVAAADAAVEMTPKPADDSSTTHWPPPGPQSSRPIAFDASANCSRAKSLANTDQRDSFKAIGGAGALVESDAGRSPELFRHSVPADPIRHRPAWLAAYSRDRTWDRP